MLAIQIVSYSFIVTVINNIINFELEFDHVLYAFFFNHMSDVQYFKPVVIEL